MLLTSRSGEVTWQDGSISEEIYIDKPGIYYAQLHSPCDTLYSDLIYLEVIDPQIQIDDIDLDSAGQYLLSVEGEMIEWYDDHFNWLHTGDTLSAELFGDTLFYIKNINTDYKFSNTLFDIENCIDTKRLKNDKHLLSRLRIEEEVILDSFKVQAIANGVRTLLIINEENDTVFSKSVDIQSGFENIVVNQRLTPGDYIFTTDTLVNIENFGYINPDFINYFCDSRDWILDVAHMVNDIDFYTYGRAFIAVSVSYEEMSCETDFIPLNVNVDTTVRIKNILPSQDIMVYPNPVNDILYIDNIDDVRQVEIIDINGRVVFTHLNQYVENEVSVESLNAGMYFIRIWIQDKYKLARFVKI